LFKLLLEYIGGWLPALGVISLVTGILYLLSAEKVFEKLKERSKEDKEESANNENK
jgi:flagellar motor component MotA